MVPNVGILEIVIVLAIALIVFGPRRLPELGRSLGKGIREFREGVTHLGQDLEDEVDEQGAPKGEGDGSSTPAIGSGTDEVEVTEISADGKTEDEELVREQREGN